MVLSSLVFIVFNFYCGGTFIVCELLSRTFTVFELLSSFELLHRWNFYSDFIVYVKLVWWSFVAYFPFLVIMSGVDEVEDGENASGIATAKELFTSVFAAMVKLPSFYQENTQFWFDSAESQFRLKISVMIQQNLIM